MRSETSLLRRIAPIVALLTLGSAWCAAQTPAAAMGREISGVVVSGKSGEPLAEAQVVLALARDRKQTAETVTDAEGRFAFKSLPDGKYNLSASHRGFVAASYEEHDSGVSTAIVTGEDLVSTGLRLELLPQATIYGTVAEDSGDPVGGARVTLYRKDPYRGTGAIQRAAVTTADHKGNFELPHLSPGAYFACAMGAPWYARRGRFPQGGGQDPASQARLAALDVAYAPTCYPDVSDPRAAEAIVVAAGDRVEVNLPMHPMPSVHLQVQLPASEDNRFHPYPQFGVQMFGDSDSVMAQVNFIPTGGRTENGPQTFEIDGLPPGQYDVEIPGQDGDTSRRMTLDAAANGVSIDLAAGTPIASVSGKVTMADGGSLPASPTVWLISRQGGQSPAVQAGADGTFNFQTVRPGDYDVVVNLSGSQRPVTNLRAKGGTLRGNVLKVGSEPIVLTGIVGEAEATVSGVVKHDGTPKSGVFIVLAPADPNAARGMWRANQSDSDGSFNLQRVAPGSYTVAAIEQGWTLDWSRQEAIGPYLVHGVKVTVTSGMGTVDLKEAVEAQPLNLPQTKTPGSPRAAPPQ